MVSTRLCLPPPRNVTDASTARQHRPTRGHRPWARRTARGTACIPRARDTRPQCRGLRRGGVLEFRCGIGGHVLEIASVESVVGEAHHFNDLPRHRQPSIPRVAARDRRGPLAGRSPISLARLLLPPTDRCRQATTGAVARGPAGAGGCCSSANGGAPPSLSILHTGEGADRTIWRRFRRPRRPGAQTLRRHAPHADRETV